MSQHHSSYRKQKIRISFCRGHPKVKCLAMMHASDFANMGMDQMERKVLENKQKDQNLAKAIEYVLKFLHQNHVMVVQIVDNFSVIHYLSFVFDRADARLRRKKNASNILLYSLYWYQHHLRKIV